MRVEITEIRPQTGEARRVVGVKVTVQRSKVGQAVKTEKSAKGWALRAYKEHGMEVVGDLLEITIDAAAGIITAVAEVVEFIGDFCKYHRKATLVRQALNAVIVPLMIGATVAAGNGVMIFGR